MRGSKRFSQRLIASMALVLVLMGFFALVPGKGTHAQPVPVAWLEQDLVREKTDKKKSTESPRGPEMTPQEREFLAGYLQKTRDAFLDSIAGLSEAQWSFKAAPERWSVAECAEHIALSEDFLFGLITERIVKAQAPADAKSGLKDEDVIKVVTDRSKKVSAPEMLKPTGRWPARADVIERFKKSREHTLAYARGTDESLRAHFSPFADQGTIDAYQFLLVLSAHSSRHTAQIAEVKSSPEYPRK